MRFGGQLPGDFFVQLMSEYSLINKLERNAMETTYGQIMDIEQKPLNTGLGPTTTAAEVISGVSLEGKVAIVTGGSSGIGCETARVLAGAGAHVIVGARDPKKAENALSGVKNVELWPLDLAQPGSIDRFADTVVDSNLALDLLINNAGIMATPFLRDNRGYELQFATNHLGHFQLTARLWKALKQARDARVVCLTSAGHCRAGVDLEDPNFVKRAYDKWEAYGQSKSANSLFAVELDRRGKEHGIRAFAVHPGGILTDLVRHMTDEELEAHGIVRENGVLVSPASLKNVEQGAATSVWCAVSSALSGKGGVYCEDCDIAPIVPDDTKLLSGVRRWAIDKPTARALWDLSEQLTDLQWLR
jgi:NAD(P)-dependent dehydrogenase (short-subunit alcohol dehydrogenase family)